jgi:hypothetical protein
MKRRSVANKYNAGTKIGKLSLYFAAVALGIQAQAQIPTVAGIFNDRWLSLTVNPGSIGYVVGSDFGTAENTTITVAGLQAEALAVSSNRIRARFPANLPVGLAPLKVTVDGRVSATVDVLVSAPAGPGPVGVGRRSVSAGPLALSPVRTVEARTAPAPKAAAPTSARDAGSGIVYTCDATINAASATACNTLNTTIAGLYSAAFTNANASIYIKLGTTGLGMSDWVFNYQSYSSFRNALIAAAADVNDTTAVADSVPEVNPLGSGSVGLVNALQRALGFASPSSGLDANGDSCSQPGTAGCYDGIITISNAQPLYFRTGSILSDQYDFFTVAQHETDEILGTASACCGGGSFVFPADYYRYHSNGNRSFAYGTNDPCSSSDSTNACFSINGVQMLQQYNNLNNQEDTGDWVYNCAAPLVQDYATCAGNAGVNISPTAEILVLDVVGYTLVSTLVPTTTALSLSATSAPVDTSVTLTATVKASSGSGTPTGTVAFYDYYNNAATLLSTQTLSPSDTAMYSGSSFAIGTHSLIAIYNSDPNFGASISPVSTLTITPLGSTYNISGQVTYNGNGLAGVTLSLSEGESGSVTTGSGGTYSFSGLPGGANYLVTPTLAGYSFTPGSAGFNPLNNSQTANFAASVVLSTLTVTESGSGTGTVTSSPAGIACGGTCSASFAYGTQVILTASPSTGSTFFGWGGACSGAGNCTLTMNGAQTVLASLSSTAGMEQIRSDFNGSGYSDLVWQQSLSGASAVYYLGGAEGATILGTASIAGANTWHIVAVADFNLDGHPDLVWQDPTTGESQIWFMGGSQGTTILGTALLTSANTWRIVAAGDFNRDGQPDLVWQDPVSGHAQIWYLGGPQGATLTGAADLTLANTWNIVGASDFNGDGQPDILWQDPVSGATQVWYLGGALGNVVTNAAELTGGDSWHVVAVADFNLDGHPDVAWQDPVSGESQVWFLGGAQGTTVLGTSSLGSSIPLSIVGPR